MKRKMALVLMMVITITSMNYVHATDSLSRLKTVELELLENEIDEAKERYHSPKTDIKDDVLSVVTEAVETYAMEKDIEDVSWAWFDYDYTCDWDFYTLDTHADFDNNQKDIYAELFPENGKYVIYYLLIGKDVIINRRDNLPSKLWVEKPTPMIDQVSGIDLSLMSRDELSELSEEVDNELSEYHDPEYEIQEEVLDLTKKEIEKYYGDKGYDVGWAWFDYSYNREWDFYTLTTSISYSNDNVNEDADVYAEAYPINSEYQLFYLTSGQDILIDNRNNLPDIISAVVPESNVTSDGEASQNDIDTFSVESDTTKVIKESQMEDATKEASKGFLNNDIYEVKDNTLIKNCVKEYSFPKDGDYSTYFCEDTGNAWTTVLGNPDIEGSISIIESKDGTSCLAFNIVCSSDKVNGINNVVLKCLDNEYEIIPELSEQVEDKYLIIALLKSTDLQFIENIITNQGSFKCNLRGDTSYELDCLILSGTDDIKMMYEDFVADARKIEAAHPSDFGSVTIIQAVQNALNNSGYQCGTADGIIGNNTKSAIKAFRNDNNLGDGNEIDQDLLDALHISADSSNEQETSDRLPKNNSKTNNIAGVILPEDSTKLGKDLDTESTNTIYYINVDGVSNVPNMTTWETATVTDGIAEYLTNLQNNGCTVNITSTNAESPYDGFTYYETNFEVINGNTVWTMYLMIQDEKFVEYELDIHLP